MIFVHARKDTVRTAQAVRDFAIKAGVAEEFFCGGPGAESKDAFEKHDDLGLVGPAGHWLSYTRYWGIHPESPARVKALLEAMGAHAARPASYERVISTGLLDLR